jgi:hypothetical protein
MNLTTYSKVKKMYLKMYLKKIKQSIGIGVLTVIMMYSINLSAQNCLPQATAEAYVTPTKLLKVITTSFQRVLQMRKL